MQLEKISLEGRYVRLEPLVEIHHGDELINADTCFEVMGINRVEFMTDYLNKTSRNAIPFLGVKEEEIMRNFMFMIAELETLLYSVLLIMNGRMLSRICFTNYLRYFEFKLSR